MNGQGLAPSTFTLTFSAAAYNSRWSGQCLALLIQFIQIAMMY